MKTNYKFMGGNISLVFPATDKVMPDGTKRSWEKSVKIIQGKKEIKVGRSFFDKIISLADDPEVQNFLEDLE